MSKRFTDTDIWSKEWFQQLKPTEKCLWFYLKDKCDNAGVWSINKPLAEFQINSKINWEKALSSFGDRCVIIQENKLLLTGFIDFQYGTLSEGCKPHKPIFVLLEKYGLTYPFKGYPEGYPKGIDTLQEKEKEKDKEKETKVLEKKGMQGEEKQKHLDFVFLTPEQYRKMIVQYGPAFTKRCIEVLDAYIANNDRGKKYKDHSKVFRQWVVNRVLDEGLKPCSCDPEKIFREAEVQDRMSQIEQETYRDGETYLSPPKGENLSQTDLSGFFKGIGRTI